MQTYAAITLLGAALLAAFNVGTNTPQPDAAVQMEQLINTNTNTQHLPDVVAPGGAQQNDLLCQVPVPAPGIYQLRHQGQPPVGAPAGFCSCDLALPGKLQELEASSAAKDRQVIALQNDVLALRRTTTELKALHLQAEVPKQTAPVQVTSSNQQPVQVTSSNQQPVAKAGTQQAHGAIAHRGRWRGLFARLRGC